jgi:hypothetical protein
MSWLSTYGNFLIEGGKFISFSCDEITTYNQQQWVSIHDYMLLKIGNEFHCCYPYNELLKGPFLVI